MLNILAFIETSVFTKQFDRLGTLDDLFVLQNDLLEDPELGAVIPLARGARKARLGSGTKGKRGGFRYIYLYLKDFGVIYLLLFYAKNEVDDLTPTQTKRLGQKVLEIKRSYVGEDYNKMRDELFAELMSSTMAVAHANGKLNLKTTKRMRPPKAVKPKEIVGLRTRLQVSQGILASMLNVSVKTVQAWEQGKREPLGSW